MNEGGELQRKSWNHGIVESRERGITGAGRAGKRKRTEKSLVQITL